MLGSVSRITSGRAFIAHVDGLRFLAIMSVIYSHVCSTFLTSFGLPHALRGTLEWSLPNSIFASLVFCGRYGVHLFFLLSGFLLSSPFAKARLMPGTQMPSLQAYYLRRVARIEPPFIISLFLIYLLKFFAVGDFQPGHLLASAFYSHLVVFKEPSLINDVLWSLEIEVQFYILAPLLASIFAFKRAWLRRGIITLFILLWGYAVPFLQTTTPQSLLWYLHYFAGGFLLADLHVCGLADTTTSPKGYLWDISGIMAFLFCLDAILSGTSDFYCPAALFLLTLAVFKGPLLNKIFSFQPIVIIGGMCYTIYLYHNQMFSMVVAAMQAVGLNLSGVPFSTIWFIHVSIAVCLMLLACTVLFICFERPFMHTRWYKDMRKMLPSFKQSLLWVPLIFISLSLVGGFDWPIKALQQVRSLSIAGTMRTERLSSPQTDIVHQTTMPGANKPNDTTKKLNSLKIRENNSEEVVLIPAGNFMFGSSTAMNARKQRPIRNIYLGAYYIDKNLITVGEFKKFTLAIGGLLRPQGSGSVDQNPVTNVTWNDANAYCKWVGKRLPSEAEWEKAALAENPKLWNFGTNFFHTTGHPWYHQVRNAARQHPYGIQDLNWKLLEWCSDWHDENYYNNIPNQNPVGPISGKFKLWKGGTWALNVVLPYAGLNLTIKPEHFNGIISFRCAADAE